LKRFWPPNSRWKKCFCSIYFFTPFAIHCILTSWFRSLGLQTCLLLYMWFFVYVVQSLFSFNCLP
jgi:hypothetical protein